MDVITKREEGTFLMLFNRSGYVLNFSTNDFDVFTTNSVGEALCEKYGLSKGKSLTAYLNNTSDENRVRLLSDLFHYYEDNMEYLGIAWSKNDDVPQLTNKTMGALNLLPANVQETDQGADAIKAVWGNLRAIPTKLAEIRNLFGSGHGKSASFQGLEERHAKLAVGSSITFVDFIWSTFENQKKTGTKVI